MTMTLTSPAAPGTISTTGAAGNGIAPAAGQAGAREDFLLNGSVGGQPGPAVAGIPAVPADSAAQAPLFAHAMAAATDGGAAVSAAPVAAAVKQPTDTDNLDNADDTGTPAASDSAAVVPPALAGNLDLAPVQVPVATQAATPAPVAANATAGAAIGAIAGTGAAATGGATRGASQGDSVAGATLYPSATRFNLPAATIAVNTPSGAAPQAGYTALQDAKQLALAQQATRVTEGIGPSSWAAYVDASAVMPTNTQLVSATIAAADAAAAVAMPATATGFATAGAPPAGTPMSANPAITVTDANSASATTPVAAPVVGATISTAYNDTATKASLAATLAQAIPGALSGLARPFNPALASNAAAMPDRQAGAASTATVTAATDAATTAVNTATSPATSRANTLTGDASAAALDFAASAARGQAATTATTASPSTRRVPAAVPGWTTATLAATATVPATAQAGTTAPVAATAPAPAPATTQYARDRQSDIAAAATAVANATQPLSASAGADVTASAAAPVAAIQPAVAAATPAAPAYATQVKLAGAPEQWQQPLREALGERLQVNLQRNSNQAVIRLDPPNMGSIEISIRQSAGALQVNLSASNSEVVRQLNAIGDTVRQDLATRQFSDVAVTVSTARTPGQPQAPQQQSYAQAQPDGGRQQQQDQHDQQEQAQERARTPGRGLYQGSAAPTFAMNDQE